MAHEGEEGGGAGGAVGIDVTDAIGDGSEAEAFDEGAAFADAAGEIEGADFGEAGGGLLDDAEGVIDAAVEDDDDLEGAVVVLAEVAGELVEYGADASLLVVGGDEEEEAGVGIGHAGGCGARWGVVWCGG